MRKIYFDMDGTIADLYGVTTWLDDITARDIRPYAIAKPLVDVNAFVEVLNTLKNLGYGIGIITWLAKCDDVEYHARVTKAKKTWLANTFNFNFDEIIVVNYGTPKQNFATKNDVLFDDEELNRKTWCGTAYNVENIVETLKKIAKNT